MDYNPDHDPGGNPDHDQDNFAPCKRGIGQFSAVLLNAWSKGLQYVILPFKVSNCCNILL